MAGGELAGRRGRRKTRYEESEGYKSSTAKNHREKQVSEESRILNACK